MAQFHPHTVALIKIARLLGEAEDWSSPADFLEDIANFVAAAGLPHPGGEIDADEYLAALREALA